MHPLEAGINSYHASI